MKTFVMMPPFYKSMADTPDFVIDLDLLLVERTLTRKYVKSKETTMHTISTYTPDYVRECMLEQLVEIEGDVLFVGRLFFSDYVLNLLKVYSKHINMEVVGMTADPAEYRFYIENTDTCNYECVERVKVAMNLCGGKVVDSFPHVKYISPADYDGIVEFISLMKGQVDAMEHGNETALEKALREARERIMSNGASSNDKPTAKQTATKNKASIKKTSDVTDKSAEAEKPAKTQKKETVANPKKFEEQEQVVVPADDWAEIKTLTQESSGVLPFALSIRIDMPNIENLYDINACVEGSVLLMEFIPKTALEPIERVPIVSEEKEHTPVKESKKQVDKSSEEVAELAELRKRKSDIDAEIRDARADGEDELVKELRTERRKLRAQINKLASGGENDEEA